MLPLLTIVILVVGLLRYRAGVDLEAYALTIAKGAILPTLPNGGWSITAEFHYYLVLPIFLWMHRKSKYLPFSILIAAIAIRMGIHHQYGEVQTYAYWTIIGRIDQFAIGMLMFQFRTVIAHRHLLALAVIGAFGTFFWYFNTNGGFFQNPTYPSPSMLWIVFPTIEGLAYATLIAWYESSFSHSTTGVSKFVGRIGAYSYSIYLLHFFVVFTAPKVVHFWIMDISNFHLACIWALIGFLMMVPCGYLSFRFIESPFLKLRKHYILPTQEK